MKCNRDWHDGYNKLDKDKCDQCFVRDNPHLLTENPYLKPIPKKPDSKKKSTE